MEQINDYAQNLKKQVLDFAKLVYKNYDLSADDKSKVITAELDIIDKIQDMQMVISRITNKE